MFKLMWQLSIGQRDADHVPHSLPFLLGTLCINFSVLFYLITIATGSLSLGVWQSVLVISLISAFTIILLRLCHCEKKTTQTLLALLSSQSVILVLCVLPYILILSLISENTAEFLYFFGLGTCGVLLITASIWLFIIYANIYRKAIDVSLNASLFISLALFSIIATIFNIIK
ncbi:MAG: hypothetical protein AB7F64_08675 [Gammaproteobacteria bacterium]